MQIETIQTKLWELQPTANQLDIVAQTMAKAEEKKHQIVRAFDHFEEVVMEAMAEWDANKAEVDANAIQGEDEFAERRHIEE